jgi:hypothetical protein
MLIRGDERQQVARLLALLVQGERHAHDCARAQARLVEDRSMARFLVNQARQETVHARVLTAGMLCLAPRGVAPGAEIRLLERYRRLLDDAIGRRDLNETLLAQQVILEGLADAVLGCLDVGMELRNLGFRRLRRTIIGQEAAHHSFGVRRLQEAVGDDGEEQRRLAHRAAIYLALVDDIIDELAGVMELFHEDPVHYHQASRVGIPAAISAGHPL